MSGEELSPLKVRVLSLVFFIVLTFGALFWFVASVTGLCSQFQAESQVIGFEKGAMYMLGCGLGLLLLTAGGVIQGFLRLDLTEKMRAQFTRGLVASVLLMVLFPQLSHYVVGKHAQQREYSVCDGATYRWLLYTKLYYTKSDAACNELVNTRVSDHRARAEFQ